MERPKLDSRDNPIDLPNFRYIQHPDVQSTIRGGGEPLKPNNEFGEFGVQHRGCLIG